MTGMKNALSVTVRYAALFLIATLAVSLYVAADAYSRGNSDALAYLIFWSFWSLPLIPTCGALLVVFFSMNRIYSSRVLGYAHVFILSFCSLSAPQVLVRLGVMEFRREPLAGFNFTMERLLSWYQGIGRLPLPELGLVLAAMALMLSASWGVSRIAAKRPIAGLFAMPSAMVGLWHLADIYVSGSMDGIFSFLGLTVSPALQTASLCTISGVGLLALDALAGSKLEKRVKNA